MHRPDDCKRALCATRHCGRFFQDLPRGDVRSKGVFKQCSGSMRRRGGKGRGARPATCQEGADAGIAVLVGLSGSALGLLRYGFAIASPRNDAIPNEAATVTCHARNRGSMLPICTGSLSSFVYSSSRTPRAVPGITMRAQFSNAPNSLHTTERANVSVVLPTNPPSTPLTAPIKLITGKAKLLPGAAISFNIC
jgi:hypothetical protein